MMLMGVSCGAVLRAAGKSRRPGLVLAGAAAAIALTIALLTPLLWTTWRPHWLLWPLESYINGVHNTGTPQPWLFPIFPWAGFAFAGLATGFILQSPWARQRETRVLPSLGVVGILVVALGRWLDVQPQ